MDKTDKLLKSTKKQDVKTPIGSDIYIPNLSGVPKIVNPLIDTAVASYVKLDGSNVTDSSGVDTAYVALVLYNTDATPPAASGFPIGTIYIQYTP